ncbi:hypothetical protein DSM106972_033620 [Dulcicalothrix desertica PCC 7102]|uniref:Pentapeptide repeat-containing protein n=1 Tax=Dulcicalothrix desertica PCC 7102 TaxID=232991 RepID=A0A3S1CN79_9CYAN|nr:pentapeptide repeat-containing protein [Dulcicalothrix desertica]RUT06156.1 hypothetical protein DSM106972_033620 [Dulcicalothrix desertica PCC 7102]TWH54185.1 uncharacterized protein YjbI with pentapeptide repeats [Dulcicalothrix desertica PCC 7102]
MSASKTDVLKNKLTALAVVFTAAPMLFFLVFSANRHLSERQKIESMNQAFTASATYFLGLAVFVNAYYVSKRGEAEQRNAIAAEKSNQLNVSNAQLAQERLVADRFMTAITQLGHDSVATRTGAIYALEGVANECSKSYWTIMEILTAFVRENAPINYQLEDESHESLRVRTDIQAALNVIARRDAQKDRENCKLDLRNTDIRRADLRKANLQHLDLRGSYLCHADLRGADLALADLDNCNFVGSVLFEANLHKANLRAANLQTANLNRAWICGANLQAANLERASLRGANLSGANLYKANLQFANLKVANLSRAKLFLANLQGAKLGKANLHNTGLIGANLYGANLNGANLKEANLNAAKLQSCEAYFANFTAASLQETNLCGANLMGSNFQRAILHETNLCGANLMGVDLSGTNVNNVRWDGANLSGAKNVEFEPHKAYVAVAE